MTLKVEIDLTPEQLCGLRWATREWITENKAERTPVELAEEMLRASLNNAAAAERSAYVATGASNWAAADTETQQAVNSLLSMPDRSYGFGGGL